MYNSTTQILVLNELIEEYTELDNETEQGSQGVAVQVEDREDENEKQQLEGKESRKRKRGADEARGEQMKERAKNFISEKAAALMEGSLKDRGFITERGLKKVITPFAEMIEKRGWESLGEHREPGCASLVKEFVANMVEKEEKKVYVRGHWVEFSKEEIKRLFNLRVQKDGSKFKKQLREPEHQKIVDLLTTEKGKWKGTRKTFSNALPDET